MKKILFLILVLFLVSCGPNDLPLEETIECTHTFTTNTILESTCVSQGIQTHTCTICTFSYETIIEPKGHNYMDTVILPMDCDSDGITQHRCLDCQYSYNEITKSTGHDYFVEVVVEATCTQEGLTIYSCNNCLHSYEENKKLPHDYQEDGRCLLCGDNQKKNYLHELFGDDIDLYTSNDRNPYGFDLRAYGSNVTAYIYEPNLSIMADPYTNVDKDDFYANYEPALSYEDSYFRSKHYLMSGDISDQYYLPGTSAVMIDEKAVRVTDAIYILDPDGNYLGYVINSFENPSVIFYGGAYTSLNEVAAYLLAFGESPANQVANKNTNGQKEAIANWGKYGRVNDNRFSGDTSDYPYEPELPNILGASAIRYHEIDFGTTGGYTTANSVGYNKTQVPYNNGSRITRGAARIVYVADTSVKSIDQRYVFYTYTHYNDFQEYLNYYDGWGIRFGNESAGNEYCSGTSDYYELNCVPPTKYPQTTLKKFIELI